jgi:hypothetical protein
MAWLFIRQAAIADGENTPYHLPGIKRILLAVIIAPRGDVILMGLIDRRAGTKFCPAWLDSAGQTGRRQGGLIVAGRITARIGT